MVSDEAPIEDLPRAVAQVTLINVVVQSIAPLAWQWPDLVGWLARDPAGERACSAWCWRQLYSSSSRKRVCARQRRGGGISCRVSWRPHGSCCAGRPSCLLILQAGLLYSAYPAFVSTAPHLMVTTFARPVHEFAWYFAFLPLGYLLGNLYVMRYGAFRSQQFLTTWGTAIAIGSCLVEPGLAGRGSLASALDVPAGRAGAEFWAGYGIAGRFVPRGHRSKPPHGKRLGAHRVFVPGGRGLAVQVLGYAEGGSPYPVLFVCLGVVTFALLLDCVSARGLTRFDQQGYGAGVAPQERSCWKSRAADIASAKEMPRTRKPGSGGHCPAGSIAVAGVSR